MKKNFIKRILITLCFFVFAFASAIGVAFSIPKSARAEGAWQTGVFEMEDGVSLQFSQVGGMRFIVKMDDAVYEYVTATESVELGIIIAPKELMLAANGDYINMPKKIGGAIAEEKIYQSGDFWLANGCITSIKYANLTRDFVAVAYIGERISETEVNVLRYTDYNDKARNNLYDLVNMAALNGYASEIFEAEDGYSPYVTTSEGDTDGWFGTEEFPIVIENTEEYNGLVNAVNAGVDFTNYVTVVKNDASPSINYDESVTNKPTLIDGEVDELNKLIAALPDSVTMPDAIGVIGRIRDAEKKYNALSDDKKSEIENYAKVESLLLVIEGYDRVYKNDATDGTVIPSYVPNYTSTVGGTATTREDEVYGNVLTVTSDEGGKAALSFTNFPSVEKYAAIYFYVKVSVGCDLYLSDGITNDGWGADWKNNWSVDGYWCNADNWRLVTIPVSSGYINTNFALGFRADVTGFTFEISDFYGVLRGETKTGLTFGNFNDSGTTNEYGTVYNFTQGWSSDADMGAFNQYALANTLMAGDDSLYFWIYNPNTTAVDFSFSGDMNSWNPQGAHVTNLPSKVWTKVVITPEIIEQGNSGTWFVGVTTGAGTSGWQISPIYSFNSNPEYIDHADVKNVIALINAIPANVTLDNKAAVEGARAAYDNLTAAQQTLVNAAKLVNAENTIADIESANEVIALIDAINPRAVDQAAVAAAREAYNALSDTAKSYVTNLATLEGYEAEINDQNALEGQVNNVNTLIANLPDSVTMPDNLVFVTRIEAARDAYNALSDEGKAQVTNYAKLRTLILAIKGYETVHAQSVDGVNVIPSHVPNYTSTIGGTATMGYDSYYGDYLKVTPNAGGKVAIQFINFPDVSKYSKIYFNIRVVGASCDIYLSDGITNDGWGDNWHNTWSMSGFWANNGNWIQKEVDPATGILSYNWALGLRTEATDVSFEITNIVGYTPDLGIEVDLAFGNKTATETTNDYGTVYDLTTQWDDSDTDFQSFDVNALSNALPTGCDSYRFWIYNPLETDVLMELVVIISPSYPHLDTTTLKAGAWTEFIISPEAIEYNKSCSVVCCVASGASTAGWQTSPIYAFNAAKDAIETAETLIGAMTENDEESIHKARMAYEALTETEKGLLNSDAFNKLISYETALYGEDFNAPFITNSESNYKIYYESECKEIATFIQAQIEKATGIKLPLVTEKPETITMYRYAIVIGYTDLANKFGLACPTEGYAIKTVGRTVNIVASSADNYRMGGLAFLSETIGYTMISEDCIIYNTSDEMNMPRFDGTTKVPSFKYRQQQTYLTQEEVYGMGLQAHDDIWISSELGMDMHNTLDYLPQETYRSAHPTWYYDYTDSYGVERTDICPTAGGSTEQYDEMISTIANALIARITEFPALENISFSMEDAGDGGECTCVRCTEYATLYGSFASAWIDLMNDVNAIVQAHINKNMPGRKLNIAFLAYRATEKAPANDDYTPKYRYEMDGKEFVKEDGEYVQDSEYLRCDEDVTVWLAPINGLYAENLNHADNAETLATIKKWCALSDNVYIWAYGTNFKNYMYPYNSWKASAENYKILADMGVKAVWSQSNETEATAFSDLKGYIDSKFMADVNADYETVLDTYFNGYFGAAGDTMRGMFDKVVEYCEAIETNNNGLGRGIYDELEYTSGGFLGWGASTKSYWTKDQVDELMAYINQAYEDIASLETSNPELYQKLYNRITKESLFPRYVLCSAYASSYSSSTKKTMRQAFKEDATALGLTLYKEADGLLSDLYSDWGV